MPSNPFTGGGGTSNHNLFLPSSTPAGNNQATQNAFTSQPWYRDFVTGYLNENPYVGGAAFLQGQGRSPYGLFGNFYSNLLPTVHNDYLAAEAAHPGLNFLDYQQSLMPELQNRYAMQRLRFSRGIAPPRLIF